MEGRSQGGCRVKPELLGSAELTSTQEQKTRVPASALLLACCVVLGKFLPLSGLSFYICEGMGNFSWS